MSNCIHCNHPIDTESGFGVFNCPNCGGALVHESSLPSPPSRLTAETKEDTQGPVHLPNFQISQTEDEAPPMIEANLLPPRSVQDLGELVDYANAEFSQGQDGLLLYSLTIEGIDSKELRSALHDILEDRRFLWEAEKMMASIRAGKLKVSNISAVKASILVKRLKHLDLTFSWEQHAIVQSATI